MALAAIVSLAIAAIAAYAFIQSTNVSRGVVESQAQKGKVQLSEKLTLIYWAPDGNAWIANDGPVRVKIVKAYVDGVAKDINVSIDPGRLQSYRSALGKPSRWRLRAERYTSLRGDGCEEVWSNIYSRRRPNTHDTVRSPSPSMVCQGRGLR
jgi:hypothetical protein